MNESTKDLLLILLVALTMFGAWLASRRQAKRVRTIKCQFCSYIGPAKSRWRPFYGKMPVCEQCDTDKVLVVKVAENSPGATTIIWADGRHCPACHADIGLWPIVKAPLPQRIRCPKCGLWLKYLNASWVVVICLVVLAVVLVLFMPVFWFTPWPLVGPLFSTAIVALISGVLAYGCLTLKLATAQHLRQYSTLIKAQDHEASADYLSCKTDVISETETNRMGRRRRWLWGSAAILAGIVLWSLCGVLWYQHAQRMKEQARLRSDEAVATFNGGEPDKALVDLTEAIRLNPKLVIALVSRANIYFRKHQLDKAMADCTEAIRVDAKSASAYECRAAVQNLKGDHDKAIADCNEALRLDPKSAEAYLSRAIAYAEKDELDKAIDDFTSTIHLNPRYAVAYYGRGRAFTQHGELSRAITDLTEAIKREPKEAMAYSARSIAYRRKGQLDKAMADCMEAIRMAPKSALAYSRRAAVYNSKGQYDKAIIDSNEALKFDPKLAIAFVARGTAYSKKAQFDKAMADFAEALQLYPKLGIAYYARGSSYIDKVVQEGKPNPDLRKSAYAQAIADLSEAIQLNPGDAEAYDKRALAYRALGEEAKAKSDENKAQQLRK